MKKYIVLLVGLFMLWGCGKTDSTNIKKDFIDKVKGHNSYIVKGTMEIMSNEDTFTYEIIAAKSNNNYRVDLNNKVNNHTQVILRNNDEVYVVTPSLNKSFKFQSDWPNNGSQGYLLDSLVDDIENDPDSIVSKEEYYVIETKVNYPNNSTLSKEKIYLDDNLDVVSVDVFDKDNNVKISISFNSTDYKPTFAKDYFELESLIDDNCCNEKDNSASATIDDIIYPLYLPTNTYLNSKDTISNEEGNRIILTFTGDSPFTLIEEKTVISSEFEVIPVYGEPLMLSETIASLSNNSLSWTSNNVDFYLSSDKLSGTELMTIAESITSSTISVLKEK